MRTLLAHETFKVNTAMQAIAALHIRISQAANGFKGIGSGPSLLDIKRLQVAHLLMARDSNLTITSAIKLGDTLADEFNRSGCDPKAQATAA